LNKFPSHYKAFLSVLTPLHQNFVPKLKAHLFPRIIERLGYSEDDFTEDDWLNTVLVGHRIYSHQLLYINYTTYDVRRSQDIIHVNTPQCNILFLNSAWSEETLESRDAGTHPYLYAKALGVYHANVSYVGFLPNGTRDLTSHRIDFVWVRWYDFLESDEEFSLDQVSFTSLSSDDALDFVDPADILRGVHLIPRFSGLQDDEPRPPTQKSKCFPIQEPEWESYYINKWVLFSQIWCLRSLGVFSSY
jgi:hypothetical protein